MTMKIRLYGYGDPICRIVCTGLARRITVEQKGLISVGAYITKIKGMLVFPSRTDIHWFIYGCDE